MPEEVTNAFTVDVESWAHATTAADFDSLSAQEKRDGVMRGLEVLLELLDQRGCKATFFVLGSVAEAVPDVVKRPVAAGHEIACHGHVHRRVDAMTPEEFETDLARSRKLLEDLSGGSVTSYRSPMWSLYGARRWAIDALIRNGFKVDSSLFPIRCAGNPALPDVPYDIRTPSGAIAEIPPFSRRGLCARYPLGGTWGFRTFFFSDIRRAVRRTNRQGHPALFHLHPWELDPERPRLQQPFWTRVALTLRLTNLRHRVDRLLSELPFGPVSAALNGRDRRVYTIEELP